MRDEGVREKKGTEGESVGGEKERREAKELRDWKLRRVNERETEKERQAERGNERE